MLPGVGPGEILLIMVLAVVLFGSKLPEVARNVGRSYNQFRAGLQDLKASIDVPKVDLNVDTMPRHEKIRHYSDVDPVAPNAGDEEEVPMFSPPEVAKD